MEKYKVNFIKELMIEQTNQKVIFVGITKPYSNEKTSPGRLNLAAIKADLNMLFLKVASDSEYATKLIEFYKSDSVFLFDITLFLGIKETSNGIERIIYFHDSVVKNHLIEVREPFFELSFIKTNEEIELNWNQEIAPSSIDIAFRDILIQLKYQSESISQEEYSNGHLIISVGKYYREISEKEKALQNMRMFPRHHVKIESFGFSLNEIKQVLNQFKTLLPTYISSRFHYDVDFLNLTLKG